ncbi:hypothetical protein ACFL6Y_02450 [Elusimicrobiota bacterium]
MNIPEDSCSLSTSIADDLNQAVNFEYNKKNPHRFMMLKRRGLEGTIKIPRIYLEQRGHTHGSKSADLEQRGQTHGSKLTLEISVFDASFGCIAACADIPSSTANITPNIFPPFF